MFAQFIVLELCVKHRLSDCSGGTYFAKMRLEIMGRWVAPEKRKDVGMNRMLACLLVGLSVSGVTMSLFADVAYLKATDTSQNSAFTNGASWTIVGVPNKDVDYVVRDGLMIMTPRWYNSDSPSVFNGRTLTLGEPGSEGHLACFPFAKGASVTFGNEGLVLCRGSFCNWYGYSVDVYGKIRVDSPLTAPMRIYANGSGTTIAFRGEISGTENSALSIYTHESLVSTEAQRNFVCRFLDGSLDGFQGVIDVRQFMSVAPENAVHMDIRTEYAADSQTCFPGTLRLGYNCFVRGESSESVVRVSNINFAAGAGINVIYDTVSKTASCVRVTSGFAHSGPIVVRLDLGYMGQTLPTNPDPIPEIPVFQAVGETLAPEDFVFEDRQFPTLAKSVRLDENGFSTLYVRQVGHVASLTRPENSEDYNSGDASWSSGTLWSDGVAPGPTNDYMSTVSASRAYVKGASVPVVFPGSRLLLRGGQFQVGHSEIVSSNLLVGGSSTLEHYDYFATTHKHSGKIVLATTVNPAILFNPYAQRRVEIAAEIVGMNDVSVRHINPGEGYGVHAFTGLNTNFFGRILTSSLQLTPDDNVNLRLQVGDARSLGGPLALWTYDALTLGNNVCLIPLAPMTLNTVNRGIYLSGAVTVSNAEELSIRERVTWDGTMTKRDGGVLAFGGPAPYFHQDKETTPVDGKNVLRIESGALKVQSSDSLEGVKIYFAADTSLQIEVPAGDKDSVCMYGLKDTLISEALTIAGEQLVVTVVDASGADAPERGYRRVGLVTVSDSDQATVSALRQKLRLGANPYPGFMQVLAEKSDSVTGTITFSAEYKKGLIISVR